MLTLKINGLNEVKQKFDVDPKAKMSDVIDDIGKLIKRELEIYPPPNSGNAPKAYQRGRWNTWYERGYGTRWVTSKGVVRGRATSENLGKQWGIVASGLQATISNNVSYAGWVHATGKQTRVHSGHGWATEMKAALKVLESAAADGIIKKFADLYN